ncbi:MAG: hypothetical protein CVV50_06030, partial [Spirochaetae bacterium HGW-Spirochaetae-6]
QFKRGLAIDMIEEPAIEKIGDKVAQKKYQHVFEEQAQGKKNDPKKAKLADGKIFHWITC